MEQVLDEQGPLYVSAVTELELFSFSALTLTEEQQIEHILRTVAILPLDSRIARIAGFVRRDYGLKTADSAIAATALFTGSVLVTRNIRDFKKVPSLEILPI